MVNNTNKALNCGGVLYWHASWKQSKHSVLSLTIPRAIAASWNERSSCKAS